MNFADMSKEELQRALIACADRAQIEAFVSNKLCLESLGIYVSGIAHEYNNLLTAIIGNLSLAKMYAKPGYEVYDVLSEAEKASFRAKDLTKQLLSLVQGNSTKKIICLRESLREWACAALADSQIKPVFSIPEDLWSVEEDELQVRKIITDAVLTGLHSQAKAGTLLIKAENSYNSLPGTELKEGKYVLITIEDETPGGKSENLAAAGMDKGDAFFCFSSENRIESNIFAASPPGSKTSLYIPACCQTQTSEEAGKTFVSGKGRILVMDDEEIVRLVVGKLLNQCGYEAELARNGEEMLTVYENALRTGNPFNAVIIDVRIRQGMGGQEAIRHLLEIDPEAKAIVSSGYAHTPVMSSFKEFGFSGFLAKPYRLEELGRILHEALSGKKE